MAGEMLAALAAQIRNPKILRVKPSVLMFFIGYMRKFRVRKVGGNLVLHSHLPPLNSAAYGRFINEHLAGRLDGPSHAQVGLTNACPQKCAYCYNRGRKGVPLATAEILRVVEDLKRLGVFWMGWTGGEPLLNKDIVRITEKAADGCAVKLFTTGCGLTPRLAAALKSAGLFSVSVSLDDRREDVHDRNRGYRGAFRTALRALEIFGNAGGLHVGVSSVLSAEMIRTNGTEAFLEFLESLGVHEAWLSEAKPSPVDGASGTVMGEGDRLALVRLQDRWNRGRRRTMTVNYLGHFEGREHFGCNAGRKMVYVDAFGEVSPCVFAPVSFGNIRREPLEGIVGEMRALFRASDECFINKNCGVLRERVRGGSFIGPEEMRAAMREVRFGAPARFFKLFGS